MVACFGPVAVRAAYPIASAEFPRQAHPKHLVGEEGPSRRQRGFNDHTGSGYAYDDVSLAELRVWDCEHALLRHLECWCWCREVVGGRPLAEAAPMNLVRR